MERCIRLCALGLAGLLSVVQLAAAQEIITHPNAIEGQYIVVLKDAEVSRTGQRIPMLAQQLARTHGGTLLHVYERALRGFAIALPDAAARVLARHPLVRYVEQDGVVFATQTSPQQPATWGLDRIDQRDLPLSNSYTFNTVAANVHAYIIDTGLRATHVEFIARVGNGFTSVNDGNGTNDCHGHGTHVAGTVGGTTYGVAKGVTLHPVRVLNCQGSGSTSGVIAGVNWVTNNHISPAVANMSLGGGASTALDDAVRNSINSGVTYAIAAGNSNADACSASPARVAQALTAGASTSADARSSFSNFGTCVDVFAPGSSITSAWATDDSATNTINGTSMATPHVAGAAALYLADHPLALPAEVHQAVISNASVNKLSGIGTGSPNRLLYSIFSSEPVDLPPVASFTSQCDALDCTFDGRSSTDDVGITGYSWQVDGVDIGPGETIPFTFPATGTYTVTLTVTDTASQTGSVSQSVAVSDNVAPCTNCTPFTGTLSGSGAVQYQPSASGYFSSGSGTHRVWLKGPANANFDVRLQKLFGFFWLTVASSTGPTSDEAIVYNGTSGTYRVRVNSVSGSGSYTVWLQHP